MQRQSRRVWWGGQSTGKVMLRLTSWPSTINILKFVQVLLFCFPCFSLTNLNPSINQQRILTSTVCGFFHNLRIKYNYKSSANLQLIFRTLLGFLTVFETITIADSLANSINQSITQLFHLIHLSGISAHSLGMSLPNATITDSFKLINSFAWHTTYGYLHWSSHRSVWAGCCSEVRLAQGIIRLALVWPKPGGLGSSRDWLSPADGHSCCFRGFLALGTRLHSAHSMFTDRSTESFWSHHQGFHLTQTHRHSFQSHSVSAGKLTKEAH